MPTDQKKTHRLHIYLIKDDVGEDSILDDEYDFKDVGIGRLYYKRSNSHPPGWMELFQRHGYSLENVFSASASALLLVKSDNRHYALTFGQGGRHMLLPGVFEERFGLITTLNSVDPKSIRSVDSKSLESEPMQVREQATKATETDRFGFNPESDLVAAITGVPKKNSLGTYMVGKDALKVSIKCDLNDLKPLMKELLKKYKEDTYKKNDFEWIDQMKEIKDVTEVAKLDELLAAEIAKDTPSKLWLTVPDIIDWNDVDGFQYANRKKDERFDDLHINDFKNFIGKPVTLDDLHNNKVHMFSSSMDKDIERWKTYNCIYFECSNDGSTYFLSNGKWYEIDKNLVRKVDDAYSQIPSTTGIAFPDYNHKSENAYNKDMSDGNNLICLDGENIYYGGSYSKIEFCDVYSVDKKIIHVKRYSGSSTLSHLFNQGANSAEALLDKEFRDDVNKKLPSGKKIGTPNEPRNSFEVVFAIVSKSDKDLEIPFFSRLSLKHINTRLRNLGYRVSIAKIKNVSEQD